MLFLTYGTLEFCSRLKKALITKFDNSHSSDWEEFDKDAIYIVYCEKDDDYELYYQGDKNEQTPFETKLEYFCCGWYARECENS